jgi:hypothetical protein
MSYTVKKSESFKDRWAIVYNSEVLMDNLFSKQQAMDITKCLEIAHQKGIEEAQARFAASIWKMIQETPWIKSSKR